MRIRKNDELCIHWWIVLLQNSVHWQIISVNSKKKKTNSILFFVSFVIFSFSEFVLHPHLFRCVSFVMLYVKTCVHSYSSYLIFIPTMVVFFFSASFLAGSFSLASVIHMYDKICFLPFISFVHLHWVRHPSHHHIITSSSLQTAMNMADFHLEKKRIDENLCTKKIDTHTHIRQIRMVFCHTNSKRGHEKKHIFHCWIEEKKKN